jgi:cell wall-associated NlpC family hydrolase
VFTPGRPFDARTRTLRCTRALLLLAVVAVGFGVLAPSGANGAPLDDMKAQAARLQHQIEANGDKISALSEQYNNAQLKLDAANAAIAQSEARLKTAHDTQSRTRKLVSLRAAELYRGASHGSSLLPTDVKTVNQLSVKSKYGALSTDRDENLIAKLERTQSDLAEQRKDLDTRKANAQSVVDSLKSAKREIEAANATQHQLLSQVKGKIATLVRQEQQRRDAAARSAVLARLSRSSGGGGRSAGGGSGAVDPGTVGRDFAPNIPAPSSRAQIAINYALAQVGKPYRYAGVGPDAYDCSGLTMMAWAQAGVSMPHASSGQYAMFPHVPFEQAQPGDLIVWGPGGNRHVAMYLGNGMQVAATHTGDYVKVQPVYGGWWGVARPG